MSELITPHFYTPYKPGEKVIVTQAGPDCGKVLRWLKPFTSNTCSIEKGVHVFQGTNGEPLQLASTQQVESLARVRLRKAVDAWLNRRAYRVGDTVRIERNAYFASQVKKGDLAVIKQLLPKNVHRDQFKIEVTYFNGFQQTQIIQQCREEHISFVSRKQTG